MSDAIESFRIHAVESEDDDLPRRRLGGTSGQKDQQPNDQQTENAHAHPL